MSDSQTLAEQLRERHAWIAPELARRWATTYGSRTWGLLEGVSGPADLGEHFGASLHAREVDYLCQQEWACEAEDILWRRTKLGLFLSSQEQEHLRAYLQSMSRQVRVLAS
ncbi:Aerobic glycerol-3-phosphate dehydrogenase [compost metagenome]